MPFETPPPRCLAWLAAMWSSNGGGGLCVSLLAHLDGEYLRVAIAVAHRAVVATLLDESEPCCGAEIIGHRLVDASRIGGPHCDLDNAVLIIAQ